MWLICDRLWSCCDQKLWSDCYQIIIRQLSVGCDQRLDQAVTIDHDQTAIILLSDCDESLIRIWSSYEQRLWSDCDCGHAVIRLWSGCDQAVIRGCNLAEIKDCDVLWLFCDHAVIGVSDCSVTRLWLETVYRMLSGCDQVMIRLWSGDDQAVIKLWAEAVIRLWSYCDKAVMGLFLDCDQAVIRLWSGCLVGNVSIMSRRSSVDMQTCHENVTRHVGDTSNVVPCPRRHRNTSVPMR